MYSAALTLFDVTHTALVSRIVAVTARRKQDFCVMPWTPEMSFVVDLKWMLNAEGSPFKCLVWYRACRIAADLD